MADRQGLLIAPLELHRRSFAIAHRRSHARLSLVVEPFFPGFKSGNPHHLQQNPAFQQGFFLNGGVVNLNGIKHTKASHCSSQITGNLQGISPRFSPLCHHIYLELLSLPQNPSPNYQGIKN